VDTNLLPLGPAALRGLERRLRAGELVRAASGERLELPALAAALDGVELVAIGESHAHREHHAIQARVIEALRARDRARPLLIGMEMFQPHQQPHLDDFVAGRIDERELLLRTRWYEAWGYDFRYYREILRLARRERLPVVALNAPAAIVRKVGRHGLAGLSPAERAQLPRDLGLEVAEHRALFRALLGIPAGARGGGHGRDPHRSALETMVQAQVVWDETMAERALAALAATPRARMVLLAGSGHLAYGLGINLRLARRRPALRQATLLCLSTERERRVLRVARGIADFVWATAPEGRATSYPSLGVSVEREPAGGLRIERLAPHGAEAARRAGLQPGDTILAVDGRVVRERAELRLLLQEKDWGDRVELRLRRGGRELVVVVRFER
jgi:uncharacterized iron-regulated protein